MNRLSVRYAAVAIFLGTMLAATFAVGTVRMERIDARGADVQAEAVAEARRLVEQEVSRVEGRLVQRAEALARHPVVAGALESDSTGWDEAVRLFSELTLPPYVTAELYTPTPHLVAWKGPSLPLGPATRTTRFLTARQTSTASDGTLREALVVWVPVRSGRQVVGAVRVFELVAARVPVRNQYLRDYSLAEQWEAEAGLSLDVSFGPATSSRTDSTTSLVRSADGTVLARVSIPTPSLLALKATIRDATHDTAAFWSVLLLGWGIAGLWILYLHFSRRLIWSRRSVAQAWVPRGLAFLALASAWVGARYGLLALGVPSRWFDGVTGSATENGGALFDPANLGSGIGGGVLGSAGELVVTAGFAVVLGFVWFRFAFAFGHYRRSVERAGEPLIPVGIWRAMAVVGAALGVLVVGGTALLIRRATLDATLPYFDRTEPLPDPLVMTVFGAMLLLALAAVLVLAGFAIALGVRGRGRLPSGAAAVGGWIAVAYLFTPVAEAIPWPMMVAFFAVSAGVAGWTERGADAWAGPLTLRGTLLGVLVLTALTYPVAYHAAEDKAEARIRDAAEEFADGEDARVAFALEGVLLDARASEAVAEALQRRFGLPEAESDEALYDSLATDLVTGSLLAALADYTVRLRLLGPSGDILGDYRETLPSEAPRFSLSALSFAELRARYAADAAPGFLVVREAAEGRGKYRYAGVGPIRRASDNAIMGWVTAQAEPKPARYISETPFPRVLVPAGLTNVVESDLAFAEFRSGVLVRARGDDYGRFRLSPSVLSALTSEEDVWRTEQAGRERVRVYYYRIGTRVIAVRTPSVIVFDHFYFYLRVLIAALVLGFVGYLIGLQARQQAGVFLRRSRLRDRVLNRFLLVGVVSVVLTGVIGQQVVLTQNQQTVEDQLKRRLARVEAALFAQAAPAQDNVPLYRLIDRARPDVVGPSLGLDVNLYREADLVASSRSQLVRQQLLDRRLPAEVYEALYIEGDRYVFAEEQIGTFSYTTGYEALPDANGRPGAVIAVPTLPEQTAIEADQARMIAYLFGVLLLLLVGIFLITTLLANRLTRPFRRLRQGLLDVGAGGPGEAIPVESSDEVGELIETFNAMRHQLDESRRKLAQQERELAWREMARQVAHEIKNPLTPMKLSVQHLRRAHHEEARRLEERGTPAAGGDGQGEAAEGRRFAGLLDRITVTLIEQIDALTRIANEFSTFARLPSQHLVRLDLRAVVREAAALIGEEEHARLALALGDEPLPILADREELRRVYINLLKNALQAMPENEVGVVTVRTDRSTDDAGRAWAESSVRDTGTGIPEDVREKVFQPNFSTKTSGMGLGLAITRKAVEELGGTIRFETEVGVGTTFFLRLPLAPGPESRLESDTVRDAPRGL